MTVPTVPPEPTPFQFAVQGRLYETLDGAVTFRRSHHIHGLLTKAKVGGISLDAAASVPDHLLRTTAQLYEAGVLFDLLAALVSPVGLKWTPAVAEAVAEQFAESSDPVEHELLTQVLFQALLAFFTTRGGSGATSDSSSPPSAAVPESLSPSDAPTPGSAPSPSSDPGIPSSASSPTTTPTASL